MLLVALAALAVFALPGHAWAQGLVVWGGSGTATAAQGELDPSLIPISTGTAPIRYSNVNGEGYDVVVSTSSFVQSGAAVLEWNGVTGWYFEGGTASKEGASIPYSTVTFQFFQTGTKIPVGIAGLKYRFEDAETGERLRNFTYTDADGNSFTPSYTNYGVFNYVNGTPVEHLSDNSIDTGAPYEGGTQEGKWMSVDLSAYAVTAFSFQAGRVDSNYGSIVMTFTDNGTYLAQASDLIIGDVPEQDVTGNPSFESGTDGANAFLPASMLTEALVSGDSSVTTGGSSQVIALYDSIYDSSGNSLTMTATQSIEPDTSDISLSTSGQDAGSVNLTAAQTVQLDQIVTSAAGGNGGPVTIAAGNNIYLGAGVDTSVASAPYTGGAVTMTAGGAITIASITTVGSSGVPGAISLTASGSIEVPAIEDDAGTGDDTQATLTAPVIDIGTDGDIAVDIQGTLSLNQPAAGGGATGAISGIIEGPGSLVINTGSGTVTMDDDMFYSGETDVQSGTLDPQGNSLVNSDLYLDGTAAFEPGVQAYGGYSGAQSITMAPYSTLDIDFSFYGYNDQVQAVGAANLSGILNVTLPSNFDPALGTVFPVLNFGSCTAQFGSYQGVRYGNMVLEPVFTGTSMV
ncbi:MAG TPA: hypothetical protein VHY22_12065, partial [Chthoniobacteraceae bacterium]|nr:hypothetical protein [Chthoniobacteraceae bacterium]